MIVSSFPSLTVVAEASDLRCDVCGRDFDRRSRLEAHYKTHTGERPFSCPFCGKSFASKGNCNTHMRVHTRERPYQCPHCDKKFSQHGQLVIHIRRHTGEKPYVCPHCSKGFTCSKVLKIHVRTHTGEKPFQCEYCHKGFAAYANLVVHRRIHTRERPYACHLCGRAFEHSGNLSRHVRVHRVDGGLRCIPCGQVFSCEQDLVAHTAHHHPHEHAREDEADADGPSPPAPSTINLQDLEQFQPPHGYQPPECEPQLTLLTPLAPSPPAETPLPQPSEAEDAPGEARGCITLSDSEDSGRESGGSTGYATSPDQAFERPPPETSLKAEAPEAPPPDAKPSAGLISTTTHRDGVRETLATSLPSAMPAPTPHIRMPPKKQQYPGGGRTPLSVLRAALSTQRPNPSVAQASAAKPRLSRRSLRRRWRRRRPWLPRLPPSPRWRPRPCPWAAAHLDHGAAAPSSLGPPSRPAWCPHGGGAPRRPLPARAQRPELAPTSTSTSCPSATRPRPRGTPRPSASARRPSPPVPPEAEAHGGEASAAERLSPLYRSSPRPPSPADADANPLDLSRPPGPPGGGGADASPLNLSQRLAGAHPGGAESCLVGYGGQAAHLLTPAPPLPSHLLTAPLPAPASSRSNILRRKSADVAHADPKKNKSRKVAPPPLIPIRSPEEAPAPAPSSRPPEALAHHHPSSMPAPPPSSSACHPYRAHIPSTPTSAPSTLVSYAPALSTTSKTSPALPSSLSPPLSAPAPHAPAMPSRLQLPIPSPRSKLEEPEPDVIVESDLPKDKFLSCSKPNLSCIFPDSSGGGGGGGGGAPSPLESMRENIQRSLLSLLPGEHEAASFKRKVETALVVLVGEAPMKQLGYPRRRPSRSLIKVLITILDMAGKGPCADVRVDELQRLKVNMRKFLEYGFPSRTSWEELGWSGRSIDSIMDNIISWISQRQNSGMKGLHVGFLEKGGGIGGIGSGAGGGGYSAYSDYQQS
nr:LOW QUALITY PROTEIN: RE1-silencing transcription factor-like [Penaeus vannamei]